MDQNTQSQSDQKGSATPAQNFNPDQPVSAILSQEKQGFVQTAAPTSAPNIANPAEKKESTILKTFASDSVESVRRQQESAARLAIEAEEQRRKDIAERLARALPMRKRLLYTAIIILLITVGLCSIVIAKYFIAVKQQPVPIVEVKNPLPSDARDVFNITGRQYADVLSDIRSSLTIAHDANTVRQVSFTYTAFNPETEATTTTTLSPELFIRSFMPQMPSILQRALTNGYALGSAGGTTNSPFLLFSTSNYDQAYGGMLSWEGTMFTDLSDLFNLRGSFINDPTFTDDILQNRDIRVLFDDNNELKLVYGFLDRNTLIITTNLQTMRELYARFLSGQFVQ